MQPREQMSSGRKGGKGGLRVAQERKGQDLHREGQGGEQAATSLHGVFVQIRKGAFPSKQMQHLARL